MESFRNLAELRLRLKEIDFLKKSIREEEETKLESKDIEKGESSNEKRIEESQIILINEELEKLNKEESEIQKKLEKEVGIVQEDLGIEIGQGLELRDLTKLRVDKIFASFETQEDANKFSKLMDSKVNNHFLI